MQKNIYKFMKKLILPVILGSVLLSCSSREDNLPLTDSIENTNIPTKEKEIVALLTEIVKTESDESVIRILLEYDNDKLSRIVKKYDDGDQVVSNIFYDGDLIASIKEGNNEYVYSYDEQKRLIKSVAYYHSEDSKTTITKNYQYIGESILIDETQKYEQANINTYELKVSHIYTIKDDLITQIERKDDWSKITTTYEYDNNETPFNNITGIQALRLEFFDDGELGLGGILKHNVKLSTSERIVSGGTTKTIEEEIYQYSYNTNGLPKNATITLTENGAVREIENVDYTYDR